MMAVHEAGHVVHAWLGGGVVDRVHVPLAGFSLTTYSVNPRPHFVAWGGPVWGCLIPLALFAALMPARRLIRRAETPVRAAQFFAGFCLISNGVYLGVGWTGRSGDAGDILRHGTPVWVLVAFGVVAVMSGLYLWHRPGGDGERQAD
jgi:hypothetical protein